MVYIIQQKKRVAPLLADVRKHNAENTKKLQRESDRKMEEAKKRAGYKAHHFLLKGKKPNS